MPLPLLGNRKRGLAFIVSAPAGSGKTTLVERLSIEFPAIIESISCTTRKPRQGEIHGKHYYFLSAAEFEEKIRRGEFLEHVQFCGHYYGTSKSWVEARLQEGKHVVLVIDTQGALLLKKHFPAIFIFVSPPSLDALAVRLRKRGTESAEEISKRLKVAEQELEAIKYYDYQIINDDLETAYQVFKSIFIAEEHKVLNIKGENL